MTTTGPGRDLTTLLDAYALLEVPLSAGPGDVRRSYRRLSRTQHPDRYPSGSAEQQAAAARMTLLDRACDDIQDAPLRFHPISRGSETVFDDSRGSVEESLRRARGRRLYRQVAAGFVVAAMTGLALASIVVVLQGIGVSQQASVLLAIALVGGAFALRR